MTLREDLERIKAWRDVNWISTSLYTAICHARAKSAKRGIPFSIEPGYAGTLAKESGGLCALSGLPFKRTTVKGQKSIYSPSLDRIIPELGYVPGNLRVILDGLNGMKGCSSDEDLIAVCKAIAERHK